MQLRIVDLQGRTVVTLVDGMQGVGRHTAQWNGRTAKGAAPAGLYFVRYEAGGRVINKRLAITR